MGRTSSSPGASSGDLDRLLGRVQSDPFFLGSTLFGYAQSRGLREEQLAESLGCTLATLRRLALCRMPDPDQGRFQEDVRRIAEFASCSADLLMRLLREATALQMLQRLDPRKAKNLLMAARDRRPSSRGETGREG